MESSAQLEAVREVVLHTLKELGMPDAEWSLVDQTVIQRDQTHFGRRFEFQGVRAVWYSDRGNVDFFDDHGRILTTAQVPAMRQARQQAA